MFSKSYGVEILEKLAEALAPGESKELHELAQLGTDTERHHQLTNLHASNEIVHNLKHIYNTYVANNIPFVEQVRLIALLPRSWSYEDIMKTFGCSRHAIKTARRMQDESDFMLKSEKEPQIRQRADPKKIKYFVSWLVESNTFVSGKVDSETRLKNRTFFFHSKVHTVLQLCAWILVKKSNY